MQIIPINTTNNNRMSFQGVTKKLSHHIFIDGKKDICAMLNRTKPTNTYLGELPPVMFYSLPKVGKEAAIKEIYSTFAQAANTIRDFVPSIQSANSEYKNRRPEAVVKTLKDMFVKYGILNEDSPFDIKFLGAGEYKKAFKLDGVKDKITGEELCFKIFHVVDRTPEWHKYKSHGVDAELNISATWKKQNGIYTQRGKFYFGDINSGFFVDKFIDKNVEPPRRIVDEYDFGYKTTDEFKGGNGHNKLYDYSIDPGGVRVVNRVKNESAIARYVLRKIKQTPKPFRELEWSKFLYKYDNLDKRQREAGLAISIKHLPNKNKHVENCLAFNNSFADEGIAYALKYLDEKSAEKYFEILMKRNDPITQTVLMNEIPLLSKERLKNEASIDDLDIPKGKINSDVLARFYRIAEKYVLPEVEEHLASYMHLLPKDQMMPEADKLIAKNDYNVNDRLLHKIKFVKEDDYSFSDKMEVLNKLEKAETSDFLKAKIKAVRTQIIRDSLDD